MCFWWKLSAGEHRRQATRAAKPEPSPQPPNPAAEHRHRAAGPWPGQTDGRRQRRHCAGISWRGGGSPSILEVKSLC